MQWVPVIEVTVVAAAEVHTQTQTTSPALAVIPKAPDILVPEPVLPTSAASTLRTMVSLSCGRLFCHHCHIHNRTRAERSRCRRGVLDGNQLTQWPEDD